MFMCFLGVGPGSSTSRCRPTTSRRRSSRTRTGRGNKRSGRSICCSSRLTYHPFTSGAVGWVVNGTSSPLCQYPDPEWCACCGCWLPRTRAHEQKKAVCMNNKNIRNNIYYTVLYCTVLYYTILYYTILYYIITILYYTIPYHTILYYTILYYAKNKGTTRTRTGRGARSGAQLMCGCVVPPISLLRLCLLRFVDSNFPGNALWTWEFHPLHLILCLSQSLWHPKS